MSRRILSTILEERSTCRLCESKALHEIISLGDQYLLRLTAEPSDTVRAPLDLVNCRQCGLVQLRHTVHRDVLHREHWYQSGVNESSRLALLDVAETAMSLAQPRAGAVVLDIGCNNGFLLRQYPEELVRIGFEPARNIAPLATDGGNTVIGEFFSAMAFERVSQVRAKIITAIAMLYDVDTPNEFVADVAACLDDDGLAVFQLMYLPTVIERRAFGTICHDHLCYYTLRSLERVIDAHGLEVFDVELNEANEGSMRALVQREGGRFPISDRVKTMRQRERELDRLEVYEQFGEAVQKIREQVVDVVHSAVRSGGRVYGYGASTKGHVLLQYCGLGPNEITAIADRMPEKDGMIMAGTRIPIVSEERMRADHPDVLLLLIPFVEEALQRESAYLSRGGRFMIPTPEVRIVSSGNSCEP